MYLLATEAAQVHVIKWLCAIRGWHWSYARCFASVVVQVKVVKRMSSVQGFIFKSYQVNIFCSGLGSGGVQVLAGK